MATFMKIYRSFRLDKNIQRQGSDRFLSDDITRTLVKRRISPIENPALSLSLCSINNLLYFTKSSRSSIETQSGSMLKEKIYRMSRKFIYYRSIRFNDAYVSIRVIGEKSDEAALFEWDDRSIIMRFLTSVAKRNDSSFVTS